MASRTLRPATPPRHRPHRRKCLRRRPDPLPLATRTHHESGRSGMTPRGPWDGLLNILNFNRGFYTAAAIAFHAACAGLILADSTLLRIACATAIAGSGYFIFVSLGVSHWIYDRSDLYRFGWLTRAIGNSKPTRIAFCHSGLDEISEALKASLQVPSWTTLDHFDPARMPEASIHRARQSHPPSPGTIAASFDHWPIDSGSSDLIFGLLAIHEFRLENERIAWFREARRCLKTGGRIVLAEHLRNPANFIAFGPGFLHFHSAKSWQRCWQAAGLRAADEFSVTPWVRFFVLVPS
ncbi:MAG: class I SAM-dependent methyltransferase [Verrucomicrobia bacterium]|nr:MAG: class I SAM-dependent methyltransferase [Verrucomicrobiota bacterium]TAF24492.1 MAG: class I SAM-dependent methyltransferase [Verrucomicrobiota bacterium]